MSYKPKSAYTKAVSSRSRVTDFFLVVKPQMDSTCSNWESGRTREEPKSELRLQRLKNLRR